MKLDRLSFSSIREIEPDRFKKIDLLAAEIVEQGPGEWLVQRQESEDAHPCYLAKALGHVWGRCECDGYQFNDGPCSHLCALWRAESEGLLEIPTIDVHAVVGDVHGRQQELADAVDTTPPIATDGGDRR